MIHSFLGPSNDHILAREECPGKSNPQKVAKFTKRVGNTDRTGRLSVGRRWERGWCLRVSFRFRLQKWKIWQDFFLEQHMRWANELFLVLLWSAPWNQDLQYSSRSQELWLYREILPNVIIMTKPTKRTQRYTKRIQNHCFTLAKYQLLILTHRYLKHFSNLISTWTKNTAQPRTAFRAAILPFRLLGNLTCFSFILQIVHNDLLEEKVLAIFPDISDGYIIIYKVERNKFIFWKTKHWKTITNAKQLQSETASSSMQQMLIWFGFETAKYQICIGYNTTSGDDQVISGASQMWHDTSLCIG